MSPVWCGVVYRRHCMLAVASSSCLLFPSISRVLAPRLQQIIFIRDLSLARSTAVLMFSFLLVQTLDVLACRACWLSQRATTTKWLSAWPTGSSVTPLVTSEGGT